MAEKKFGNKRICQNCSTKFYDMLKPYPLVCPHCNDNVETDVLNNYLNSAVLSPQPKKNQSKVQLDEIENENILENDSVENDEIISLEEAENEIDDKSS